MEKLVFANNLLPDTNKEEISLLLRQNDKIIADGIHFITYNFMNQVIRLNCAFISFSDTDSVEKFLSPDNPPIEINGHLISLQAATDFVDLNPTAIILGDSSYLTKDAILSLFKAFNPVDVNVVYSNDIQYFTIVFRTKENRDEAVKNNRHFIYKRNTYSLRPFGLFPEETFPTICGLNHILNEGQKKKKKKMFELKHLNQSYFIDPIIGAAISGKIRKELTQNPKLKELTLPSIKGNFAPVADIFWNKQFKFDEKDFDLFFLYHMSSFLEIESFIEFLEDDYYNLLDSRIAIDEAILMCKMGIGFSPNIRYLASHLTNFVDLEKFHNLPIEILQLILSSKYICDDEAAIEKLNIIVSQKISKHSDEDLNKNSMNDEYENIVSDYSLDLNTLRYKFIEYFDLGVNQDPNSNQTT